MTNEQIRKQCVVEAMKNWPKQLNSKQLLKELDKLTINLFDKLRDNTINTENK